MEFPKTNQVEDDIASNEAFRIYGDLRKRYDSNTVRDFDIILNTLSFALIRLFKMYTMNEDAEKCGELVSKIIVGNLKK